MHSLHALNIFIHVTAGAAALITGLIAISVRRKRRVHIRFGRQFMWMMIIVVLTALLGVLVFRRSSFLLIITLLSGYNCFSGIRTIKLSGNKPGPLDLITTLAVVAATFATLLNMQPYWAPAVTASTIGAIFLVAGYDLAKIFFGKASRKKAMLYEHVYKMISALSGLASAFAGTVFPQFKPYSQLLPSAIGLAAIIAIFIQLRKWKSILQ